MKASNKFLGAALAALVLGSGAAAAPASAANLIADGDFSQPNTHGGWGIFSAPAVPWTNATDSGVEIGYSGLYGLPCANSACQNLEVNANTFGDVSQTVVNLQPGVYDLSFLYGGRNGGGPQALDVLVNGNQIGGTISNSPATIGNWTSENYKFLITGHSAKVEFLSLNVGGNPSYGNEITNVSMTAVPEPATWAMMILGVAMIGFAARRRSEGTALAA